MKIKPRLSLCPIAAALFFSVCVYGQSQNPTPSLAKSPSGSPSPSKSDCKKLEEDLDHAGRMLVRYHDDDRLVERTRQRIKELREQLTHCGNAQTR
jgi:hypothetical protein